jgi:hydroxymethylbilane synthase
MSVGDKIILATRKSPLALKQAELVADLVREKMFVDVELLPMSTTGDRQSNWSLQEKGGKGLFTKELESALLENRADIAVHSAKDMPTEEPPGLVLAAFPKREDARDVLVRRVQGELKVLASGSPRRVAQLSLRFPSVSWIELRGNVGTRLRKISIDKQADGTILAAAGLSRLGITEYSGVNFEKIPVHEVVPAPGQAAIAIQVRSQDREKFLKLDDAETSRAVRLERGILDRLGGGCQVALGVHVCRNDLYFFHEKCGVRNLKIENNSEEIIFQQILTWLN